MISKGSTTKSKKPLPLITKDFSEVSIEYLFKYKPFNKHLLESLTNRQIYFSRPTELNDPFEFRQNFWNHKGTFSNIYKKLKKDFDNGFTINRVFCMTRNPNNCLMWSHYADSHQGVCIGYKSTEFSSFKIQKIKYVERIPGKTNYSNVIHTKGKMWSYEKEVRITSKNKFEKATPSMIIFGAKTNLEQIIEIVNAIKHYGVQYYYVSDLDSRFSLQLRKITKKQILSGYIDSIFPYNRIDLFGNSKITGRLSKI